MHPEIPMVNHELMTNKMSTHLTLKNNRTYVKECKKMVVFWTLSSSDARVVPHMNHLNHSPYNQHGIHVKGRLPSMLKATMKVAIGTS